MDILSKTIVSASAGFFSFGVGTWLRFAADSLSTHHILLSDIQDGGERFREYAKSYGDAAAQAATLTSQSGEQLRAFVATSSAFLWLGVALLVLSAAAWLFFVPARSSTMRLAAEPTT